MLKRFVASIVTRALHGSVTIPSRFLAPLIRIGVHRNSLCRWEVAIDE